MEIVDESGKAVGVDMGSQGSVPTVKVGGGEDKVVQGDADSMIEMVGRIIDNLPPDESNSAVDEEIIDSVSDREQIVQEVQPVRDEL